jgi:MOSC domain-containing protein YiiM
VREDAAVRHLTAAELTAALDHLRAAPPDAGELKLVVRRPAVEERDVVTDALLDPEHGVVGDNWLARGSRHTPDGAAELERQVTIMNIRAAELVAAGDPDRVPLAGDQLYVDLDISIDNLPAGSLLRIGEAVLEISASPHLGCAKFVERFGAEAMRFVNSRTGRALRLRGLNARVVVAGAVRVGDPVTTVPVPVPTQVDGGRAADLQSR